MRSSGGNLKHLLPGLGVHVERARKVVGTPPGKGDVRKGGVCLLRHCVICEGRRGNRMLWGRWNTDIAEEDVVGNLRPRVGDES